MKRKRFLPTTIIGAGAVGSALALALYKSGYPIVSIISKTKTSAKKLARKVHCNIASTNLKDVDSSTQLIIIAVPDSAIMQVSNTVALLKTLNFKQVLVVHTSGMYPASTLHTIEKKGASVASLHPIQTFPKLASKKSLPISLDGIYYGVDCKKELLGRIRNIIHDLNGNMVIIPAKFRRLYHATCVFSSSYFVMLSNIVSKLSKSLGLKEPWHEVFGPLMTTSMNNSQTLSPAKALTGPIIRGDNFTLQQHLVALAKFAPEFLPVYTFGAIEVACIAAEHGRITQQEAKQVSSIIKDFYQTVKLSPKRKVTK